MSVEFYRMLHIFGLFLLFTSLGAAAIHAMNGGTKESNQARKWVSITHGVALFLVLLAGFGLLAKSPQYEMSPSGWPGFIYFKIGLWLPSVACSSSSTENRSGRRPCGWYCPYSEP